MYSFLILKDCCGLPQKRLEYGHMIRLSVVSNIMKMIARELNDGCHINPERKILNGLGTSHLHTAKALREELPLGGFDTAAVHGVMGGAWLAPNLDELLANEKTKAVLMKTVRMLDTHEEIIGLSGHLLAVSRKKA